MRHALFAGLVLLSGLLLAAPRPAVAADDEAFVKQHLSDLMEITTEPLDSAAAQKVLASPVYNVKIHMADSSIEALVARDGDKLVELTRPSTNADMPGLAKLVSAQFTLKTDADGKTFEKALDALYPISTFSDSDKKVKAIRHEGHTWTFIRKPFFDDLLGFVVTTNDSGHVTAIKFSLEIKK